MCRRKLKVSCESLGMAKLLSDESFLIASFHDVSDMWWARDKVYERFSLPAAHEKVQLLLSLMACLSYASSDLGALNLTASSGRSLATESESHSMSPERWWSCWNSSKTRSAPAAIREMSYQLNDPRGLWFKIKGIFCEGIKLSSLKFQIFSSFNEAAKLLHSFKLISLKCSPLC